MINKDTQWEHLTIPTYNLLKCLLFAFFQFKIARWTSAYFLIVIHFWS